MGIYPSRGSSETREGPKAVGLSIQWRVRSEEAARRHHHSPAEPWENQGLSLTVHA